MSGRVSIKGQGAEIFFGEAAKQLEDPDREIETTEDDNADHQDAPMPPPESKPASKTTDQPASQQTGLPASKQDSKQATIPLEAVHTLSVSTRRKLRDLLEREHRTHNTYRYHDDELAALLWAIEDYTLRGEESYLLQLLKEGD